jgi:hypothetical protein
MIDIGGIVILSFGIPFSIWVYYTQVKLLWNQVVIMKGVRRSLLLGHNPKEIRALFDPYLGKIKEEKKEDDIAYEDMYR